MGLDRRVHNFQRWYWDFVDECIYRFSAIVRHPVGEIVVVVVLLLLVVVLIAWGVTLYSDIIQLAKKHWRLS